MQKKKKIAFDIREVFENIHITKCDVIVPVTLRIPLTLASKPIRKKKLFM